MSLRAEGEAIQLFSLPDDWREVGWAFSPTKVDRSIN